MIESRKYIIQGVIVLVGIIFLSQLFSIQIADTSYRDAADNNIILEEISYPSRGLITDRNGKLLVYNEPIFDLMVTPSRVKVKDTLAFCEYLGISQKEFEEKLAIAKDYSTVKASVFMKQVSLEEFAGFQDKLDRYRGFRIVARTVRAYQNSLMANALGYISEISKSELAKDTINYYQQGDYIGKSGLESYYETQLRGKRGKTYKIRNVRGVEKGSFKDGLYDTLPIPGLSLKTTIDLELQQYGEKLLAGKSGSIVAIEPSSGEILSIISAPTYNPSLLSGRKYSDNFRTIANDTLKPLFNRPLMAAYRPGSIFKIAQALVALEEGVIEPDTRLKCNTALIGCHHSFGHPYGTSANLIDAITNSCNPYFVQVLRRVVNQGVSENTYEDSKIGLDKWQKSIESFGFNAPVGIDLPGEKSGLIPDAAYYTRAYGGREWKYSNIISIAIGEGENLVVPIQMANFAATIANRGFFYIPHLVKSIGDSNEPLEQFKEKHYTSVSSKYFDVAVEAMAKVVESGTGQYRAKLNDIVVCGKTGTVQNDPMPDHSVFIAFAPKDNPKIAVSVYVEDAGQGARAAASIAGLMIEKYIKRDSARLYMENYVLENHFLY